MFCHAGLMNAGAHVGSKSDSYGVKHQGQLGIFGVAWFCFFGRPAVATTRRDVDAVELRAQVTLLSMNCSVHVPAHVNQQFTSYGINRAVVAA